MDELAVFLPDVLPVGEDFRRYSKYSSKEAGTERLNVMILRQNSVSKLLEGIVECLANLHRSVATLPDVVCCDKTAQTNYIHVSTVC